MKKSLYILFFIFLNSCFVFAQKNNEDLPKWRTEIESMMNYYTQMPENYGIAISVIQRGNIYDFYDGKLSAEQNFAPDSSSVFELGGLAKVFTAASILQLAENEIIELKKPITHYLDFPFQNDFLAQITIQQLLTHTAGFSRKPKNLKIYKTNENLPWENYDKTAFYDYLSNYKPQELWAEGENFEYSDTGYCLLAMLLEKLHPEIQYYQNPEAIQGHNTRGEVVENWQTPYFLTYSVNLNGNLAFVKSYVSQLLNPKKPQYLQKQLLPQGKTKDKKVKIAYAWHLVKARKKGWNIYTHAGATTGFRSFVAFNPMDNTAIIILANTNTKLIDNIGVQLLYLLN